MAGYLGNIPTAVPLTSADIADGIISSAKIADGTIVNADINASAGIDASKLSGVANTPAFFAYAGSTTSMTSGSSTKITLNTEVYDTNNAFASNAFTVPSGQAGKYFFAGAVRQGGATSNRFIIMIRKNGNTEAEMELSGGVSGAMTAVVSTALNLSVSDYIELFCYHDQGTTQTNTAGINNTWFTGFKLIGV